MEDCVKRNVHDRRKDEIVNLARGWEKLPNSYVRLDVRQLLQDEAVQDVSLSCYKHHLHTILINREKLCCVRLGDVMDTCFQVEMEDVSPFGSETGDGNEPKVKSVAAQEAEVVEIDEVCIKCRPTFFCN